MMDYSKIVLDICNKIGVSIPDGILLEWIKNEIQNVSYEIFSITEVSKSVLEHNVDYNKNYVDLPSDFYIPQEVIFYDSDGKELRSIELQYEQFLRDNLYDSVSYVFSNIDNIQKLEWKPAFSGKIIVYYISLPVPMRVLLNDAPSLNVAFYECISDGVALRWLKQNYIHAKTQEDIFRFNNMISMYDKDYELKKQRILSYSKKTASTQQIENWDFLNDPNMMVI